MDERLDGDVVLVTECVDAIVFVDVLDEIPVEYCCLF
jgi:hypothetical protein